MKYHLSTNRIVCKDDKIYLHIKEKNVHEAWENVSSEQIAQMHQSWKNWGDRKEELFHLKIIRDN